MRIGKSLSRRLHVWLFLTWVGVVGSGLGALWRHAQTPGRPALAPNAWPARSHLLRSTRRATLILVAHPQCPCTRATVNELVRLLARCRSRITVYALFYRPSTAPAGWEQTDTYAQAARMPGVRVVSDVDGREARRFGAVTSGQCLLYDTQGNLLFSGGLTPGRGHEGYSIGQSAIFEAVFHRTPVTRSAPVYGCSLFERASP